MGGNSSLEFSDPWRRIFDALSSPLRRQLLIGLLKQHPGDDGTIDPLDTFAREEQTADLRIELVHVHLPKLEASGFVEWDRQADEISKGDNWEEIVALVQLIQEHRDGIPEERL